MPTYTYEKIMMPDEAVERARNSRKTVRISYWKKFGDDPPGWLVGVGRIEGNRFILEEEFVAEELLLKTDAYGFVGFQRPEQGEAVDRGWIIAFAGEVKYDGQRCIIS
uniref:Uncharacterized protein n=2 Tax=Thermoproteati TaxID=1783275 RepID=H5SB61_9CREN|nr:hypothetical protein HGMM_F06G04C06 [uncultured crenarchaeote]